MLRLILPGVVAIIFAVPAHAAGTVIYDKDDNLLTVGGQVQIQFYRENPDPGDTTSDLFIRRFHLYTEARANDQWMARLHGNFSKSGGDYDFNIKDAYIEYSGLPRTRIRIGNAKFPFSREYLTSSQNQQLVERTFAGERKFGVPERDAGVHISGRSRDKRFTWEASAAEAKVSSNGVNLEFDTPVNGANGFDQGWILGGRMDVHPFGFLEFSQGDFSGATRVTVGVAAYRWENDNDKQSLGTGIDSIAALEISGAARGKGVSVDAQYNRFEVDTIDANYTGGAYRNGKTTLKNWSIKGGYMILPEKLELVAGFESQDADNYADQWTRASLGANWFIAKHNTKLQLTYRRSDSVDGRTGGDRHEVFAQSQTVF